MIFFSEKTLMTWPNSLKPILAKVEDKKTQKLILKKLTQKQKLILKKLTLKKELIQKKEINQLLLEQEMPLLMKDG